MKIFKAPIYFILVAIMITNGCYCGGDEDDDGLYELKCENIEKVIKTFTFEVYAKYAYNNEPLQGEGNVTLAIHHYDYVYQLEEGNNCKYDLKVYEPGITENFDANGKAVIITPPFEFDNKHDHLIFSVTVHFPFSSDQDQFMNTQYGSAKYNSEESTVLFFKYKSLEDL